MFQVTAKCPTRIDLAGGTLDLWPLYHQLLEKSTVNLGITLHAETRLSSNDSREFSFVSADQNLKISGSYEELAGATKLPLLSLFLKSLWTADMPPISLEVSAKSPKGAGLGGSSALAVSLCSAFFKARELFGIVEENSEEQIVAFCSDLESKLIKSPTGVQDYWGAIRGGLNLISYPFGGVKVETLSIEQIPLLNEGLVVTYSGQSRDSAINNWSVYQNFFSGDSNTVKSLEAIGKISAKCADHLKHREIIEALELSKEEWELRKRLWPGITTERTEFIDKTAHKAGANFSRVCGAGGGGVMALFTDPDNRKQLVSKLEEEGVQVLKQASVTDKPLHVTY